MVPGCLQSPSLCPLSSSLALKHGSFSSADAQQQSYLSFPLAQRPYLVLSHSISSLPCTVYTDRPTLLAVLSLLVLVPLVLTVLPLTVAEVQLPAEHSHSW